MNPVSDLDKQIELVRQTLELKKREEPIYFFKPHKKQQEASSSKADIRLVLGGNRSGKTEWDILEVIANLVGFRPWLPPDHPDYFTKFYGRAVTARMFGEDFNTHLKGVLVPKLRKWIPKKWLVGTPKKNQQGVEVFWQVKSPLTGLVSSLELMSYEQGSEKAEGWSGHFVAFDEPPPRDVFIAAVRGLTDYGGLCWFSMTPLKEPWIYDDLWCLQTKEEDEVLDKDSVKEMANTLKGMNIFAVTMDMRDNVGYGLTEEAIIKFESLLNEDEKEARIHGRFTHLQGLIYKEFDPRIHVLPDDVIDEIVNPNSKTMPECTYYEAIDPHLRKPHAVSFMAVAPDGTKYIYDEIWEKGLIKEIAQIIKLKRRGDPVFTLIDPLAVTPDPISGSTILNEFIKEGVKKVIEGSKDRERGINLLHTELKLENGRPGIYIARRCVQTISNFQHYIWDDYTGRAADKNDPKQSPRKKNDDFLECIHRLLCAGAAYRRKRTDDKRKNYPQGIDHGNKKASRHNVDDDDDD